MWNRRHLAPISILLITGVAAVACGGDDQPVVIPSASPSVLPSAATTAGTEPAATNGAAAPESSLDLANTKALLTVLPPRPRDFQTGISSVATGDFNGDGIGDILAGLPFGDGPGGAREDAGEAYVIFGKKDLHGEVDLAQEKAGLTVWGAVAGDNLGFGVAAGDLNGDGIDDVIIGAPGSNGIPEVRTDLGEAYVVFGRRELGGARDIVKREQDFTLIAAEGFARLGTSFATADVNGDGVDDLIAGAPFGGREPGSPPGSPRTTVGEVYVVLGRSDLAGLVDVAKGQEDFAIEGVRPQDELGLSVAAADVNGDGIADIIAGAPGYDGPEGQRDAAGAAVVYFGSEGLSGKRGVVDADFTVLGGDEEDSLGDRVAVGDVDGDGLADILAVARGGDGPEDRRPEAGDAYAVYGSRQLSGTQDLALTTADAVVYGPEVGALIGTGVAVGDIDGDGKAEVVLGTPLMNGLGRSLSGVTFVVSGAVLKGTRDLQTDGSGALYVYGARENDALGTGAAIGDVNGDGRPELMLMAAADQGQSAFRGTVYAISLP